MKQKDQRRNEQSRKVRCEMPTYPTSQSLKTAVWKTALWWLCVFWLLGAGPAEAQVRPASKPIVTKRIQHIAEMIPGSRTDLPAYLATPHDVYLLITAGGAYTEIVVLANPETSPAAAAQALSSALAGTPLRGQTVTWSADRYSAAQITVHFSQFGALTGSQTVPVGTLAAGLRRAGLNPHLLLRVPVYAKASVVPRSHYGSRTFRWYDLARLRGQSNVTVTATLSPVSVAEAFACALAAPLLCLAGLGLSGLLSGRGNRDTEARRRVSQRVSLYVVQGVVLAQVGGFFVLLRTSTPAALADLWLGSSTAAPLVPVLIGGVLCLPVFLFFARRRDLRRFGPVPGMAAIPMSDEEKAVRQRVTRWSMLPHLVGALALGAVPFFISRTSPLYPFVHPIAMFLPMIGAGLAAKIFQKQLGRFTQKTLEDGLTWRARELGQMLGVRMPDVFVEDSSRAAHLAFASHQGHHLTLSRKLVTTFTPAETDFVLAHHLACMKRHTGSDRRWLRIALPLLMLIPFLGIVAPRVFFGVSPLTTSILSFQSALPSWSLLVIAAYFCLFVVLTLALNGGTKGQVKQDADADRTALEVTGDLDAALSALGKLEANPALAASPAYAANPELARTAERLQQGRLLLRRMTLEKTALTLRFAAAPGTAAPAQPDTSPFVPAARPEQETPGA